MKVKKVKAWIIVGISKREKGYWSVFKYEPPGIPKVNQRHYRAYSCTITYPIPAKKGDR